MDLSLQSLTDVLDDVGSRLSSGTATTSRIWPTGFSPLDHYLSGGFRSGDLVLLGGPQGLGKTALALQIARNAARSGRPVVYFSYEHDHESMLARLVALEAGLTDVQRPADVRSVREAFEAPADHTTLEQRLGALAGGSEALREVRQYGDLLTLHRSSGRDTDRAALVAAVDEVAERAGNRPMMVVDYLQKVPVRGGAGDEEERTTTIVEGLKDLALDRDLPILAIVAADKAGLAEGRRMRVSHLRGSTALAYEADTVLLLNNKYDMVARHHLVYDTTNAEKYRRWAVLSLEKNRSGLTGIDLEFRKRLDLGRFDPDGQLVSEQLVEDRMSAG
jgi:replicative DNA helicase